MIIELEIKLFVGTISYEDIETGFWSISDEEKNYRITNTPEELKKDNLKVAAIIKETESDNDMSYFMTGQSAEILEYKIIK